MLFILVSCQYRAWAAENPVREACKLRSIASERHRFRLKSVQHLETARSISSESLDTHRPLPRSHLFCNYIRAILHPPLSKTELGLRTGYVLHNVADHLIGFEGSPEIHPACKSVAQNVLRIVTHKLSDIPGRRTQYLVSGKDDASKGCDEIIEIHYGTLSVLRIA